MKSIKIFIINMRPTHVQPAHNREPSKQTKRRLLRPPRPEHNNVNSQCPIRNIGVGRGEPAGRGERTPLWHTHTQRGSFIRFVHWEDPNGPPPLWGPPECAGRGLLTWISHIIVPGFSGVVWASAWAVVGVFSGKQWTVAVIVSNQKARTDCETSKRLVWRGSWSGSRMWGSLVFEGSREMFWFYSCLIFFFRIIGVPIINCWFFSISVKIIFVFFSTHRYGTVVPKIQNQLYVRNTFYPVFVIWLVVGTW